MKSFRVGLLLGLLLTVAGFFVLGLKIGSRSSSLKNVEIVDSGVLQKVWDKVDYMVDLEQSPEARFDTEEGRLAAVTLAEENELLRERVVSLDEQVHELMLATASERVEADLLRMGPQRTEDKKLDLGRPVALPPAGSLRVLQVDEKLGLVAVDGGRAAGLSTDMRFHVVREDRRVATVRVVEVRETLAAAVTEGEVTTFPAPGDRLLSATREDD